MLPVWAKWTRNAVSVVIYAFGLRFEVDLELGQGFTTFVHPNNL